MGQSCGADDVNICRKQTPNLPTHESIIQRNAQEHRWWENVNTLFISLTRERLKLFFAQLFLLISSVFGSSHTDMCEECDTCQVKQGDLLWQDNLTHCSCQIWWRNTYFWPMILHKKKICCKDIKERIEKLSQQVEWVNSVLMQDSWPQLKSDSTYWRKTLKNFHNSQIQWPIVCTLCQEVKNHQIRRLCVEIECTCFFSSRSKAKAKQPRRISTSSSKKLFLSVKELGPILNRKIIRLSIIHCRRNWLVFFVMVVYLEKMMERLNSGDWKMIFRTILCILNIGLMKSGRASWQEEEETRKDTSVVLILQEKFFSSELFKVIQDAILLILHYRTMSWFWTILQVHLSRRMCNHFFYSIINSGLIPGSQNLSKRQTVFFLPVNPMDKEHKRPWDSWPQSTASCTVHPYSVEETLKRRRIGSTSNLHKRKD